MTVRQMQRRYLLGIVALGALLLGPSRGLAQDLFHFEEDAKRRFELGREAAAKGKFELACAHFEASRDLHPSPEALLRLVDCEEKLGKLGAAVRYLKEALQRLSPNDPRLGPAKTLFAMLDQRAPRLRVVLDPGAPNGSRVLLDRSVLGPSDLNAPTVMDPGKHVIVVEASQRLNRSYEIWLDEGQRVSLLVGAGSPPIQKTLGIIGLGLGGAGLLVGGITGALALSKYAGLTDPPCDSNTRTCPPELQGDVKSYNAFKSVSVVGFAVGSASFVLGLGALATLRE